LRVFSLSYQKINPMPKIKDLPKHKRPREKLAEKGAENLSDAELMAILIRTGRAGKSALDIARETLKKYPLSKLLAISKDELAGVSGLQETMAITIKAALELGSRAVGNFNDTLPILDSVKSTVSHLSELRGKQKEHFIGLYLNARRQLVHKEIISIGTITETLVHPREVFEPAISHFASSIILAHNHPSQSMEVSEADIKLTEKLIQSGAILDIEVLDHITITADDYVSFKEKGLLF
jgi:DNA repair protein RadC